MSASLRIAEFSSRLTVSNLPDAVKVAAGLHALDTVGCGLAAVALREADFVADYAAERQAQGDVSVIGHGSGMSAEHAALVNGTRCHALDYDDTHPDSVVHVSAAVTPAALAAGEATRAAGADVLAAIVAGNEVSTRIGTVGVGHFHTRGFHPTGMVGVFGATVAVARVYGLDAATTAHALGLAGSMAGGLLEFLSDGAQTKPLHPGLAAQSAFVAVGLARHGATGPATVFEGRRGFFATYLYGQTAHLDEQLGDLGDRWETPRIAYKPYSACHYTHAPVDALADIMRRERFGPEDVEAITAFSDATGVGLVLEPAGDKVHPRTAYDSKFSLPYCLAHQLVHGHLDVHSFSPEQITDGAVLALTPKVGYETRVYGASPDSFAGGVRVRLHDGRVLESEIRHQRGGANNPMTDEQVREKYRANAGLALGDAQVSELENLLGGLAAAPDLRAFAAVRSACPA